MQRSTVAFQLALGLSGVTLVGQVWSQDQAAESSAAAAPTNVEEYARFRELAASCQLETAAGAPLHLPEESVMNWTNPARNNEMGSIFVWEANGRPEVIGTVFTFESAKQKVIRTKLLLHSLSDAGVSAEREGQKLWAPTTPGLQWRAVAAPPAAASTAPRRLVEMRSLARRFEVEMTLQSGESETLRLLPQPLVRYAPTAGTVNDGAIFAFVTSTDPEALLVIEGVSTTDGQLKYRYAFARFHYCLIKAVLDSTEVWRAEPELDQRFNSAGDASFQSRVYSSMIVAERPVSAP